MTSLVWVEHDNAVLKDATLSAVTAAAQLGDVVALVVGQGCSAGGRGGCADRGRVTRSAGDDAAYAHGLAEMSRR
jgi:electron transfer flavoprotein alpha subunit